jgi:hypothetical protein
MMAGSDGHVRGSRDDAVLATGKGVDLRAVEAVRRGGLTRRGVGTAELREAEQMVV